MHGLSVLVSHTVYTAISLGIFLLLLSAFLSNIGSWQSHMKEDELKLSVLIIKNAIMDIYTISKSSDNINLSMRLPLTPFIGDKQYEVIMNGKIITALQDNTVFNETINLPINLTGRARPPALISAEKNITIKEMP